MASSEDQIVCVVSSTVPSTSRDRRYAPTNPGRSRSWGSSVSAKYRWYSRAPSAVAVAFQVRTIPFSSLVMPVILDLTRYKSKGDVFTAKRKQSFRMIDSLRDLAGRPWVAGPPGTACDQALRRLASEAGIAVETDDVCVEFPSVLALVADRRIDAAGGLVGANGQGTAICPAREAKAGSLRQVIDDDMNDRPTPRGGRLSGRP